MMNRKTILAGWCVLALSAVLSAGAQEDFFAAIRSNNVTKLRALLDRNPFISFSTDKDGATPLAAALSSPGDTLDAGRALVESGADLNGISRGVAPMHMAVMKGDLRWVQMLLEAGAEINVRDSRGRTPLRAAVLAGNNELGELLVNAGAKVEAIDAAAMGDMELLRHVLNVHPTAVNERDDMGNTPLHYAVMRGRADAVKLLLSRAADRKAKNNPGDTPFKLAQKTGRPDIIALLKM